MKRLATLFFLVALVATFAANAQDTMTFIAGSDVCTPMTVSVGGRSYTVRSSITIERVSGTVRATDCNGRKLKYDFGNSSSSRQGTHLTYTFHNAYDPDYDSPSSGSGSYNGGGSDNNGRTNNNSETYAAIGHGLSDYGTSLAEREGGAYPGLHANLGISKGYGEFLRLRFVGHGLQAYASIGKDWLFDGDNKDKFLWHAGFGGYFTFGPDYSRCGDVSFGITAAENAAWENLSLTVDINVTYWFGRWKRVGAFAGAGFGLADIKDWGKSGHHTKAAWNLEIGFTFRLATF